MQMVRYTAKAGAAGQIATVGPVEADNLIKAGLAERVDLERRSKPRKSPRDKATKAPVVKDDD